MRHWYAWIPIMIVLAAIVGLGLHGRSSVGAHRDIWILECVQADPPHEVLWVKECAGRPEITTRRDGTHFVEWRSLDREALSYVCNTGETLSAEPCWGAAE